MSDSDLRPEDQTWESPAAVTLGKKVISVEPGRVKASYYAGENFINRGGRIYGGFLAAMLDGLCGHAVRSTHEVPGTPQVTLEMKTSFLGAAGVGELHGEGWVRHRGKSIAFAEAELFTPEGVLVARASATFKIGK
ncbi:PaaI family thioesterase [Tepidicaulis sp.]|uniref:PaaI family thioesterase n=1 Tax=Tepidicaulis sp. TaxID=1920809 RepID=UPI003B598E58